MLVVANKPYMPSNNMLSVEINLFILSNVMLSVIMLSVVVLAEHLMKSEAS